MNNENTSDPLWTDKWWLKQYLDKAEAAAQKGNLAEAEKQFQDANQQSDRCGNKELAIETLRRVASVCWANSLYKPCEAACKKLLVYYREDQAATLETLQRLSRVLEAMERFAEAIDVLKEILPIEKSTQGEQSDAVVKTLERLAALLNKLGRQAESMDYTRQVQEIARQKKAAEQKQDGSPLVAKRMVFVGQILQRAGLIKYADLNRLLKESKSKGTPIGTVLVAEGFINDVELEALLQLQSLTRDDAMSLDQAAEALETLRTTTKPIAAILQEMGVNVPGAPASQPAAPAQETQSTPAPADAPTVSRPQGQITQSIQKANLGTLLIDSGLITVQQLETCLKQRDQTGEHLGKILLAQTPLTEPLLNQALNLQLQVRDKGLPFAEAVAKLKEVKAQG